MTSVLSLLPIQGFLLELHHLFTSKRKFVDMILEKAGPVLELVHDVPRRRHGDVNHHRGVCNGAMIVALAPFV